MKDIFVSFHFKQIKFIFKFYFQNTFWETEYFDSKQWHNLWHAVGDTIYSTILWELDDDI